MTVEFRLPDVGEGVAEGEIVDWLVETGDTVTEDQPVVEVETDKAVVEVPAPVNGTVVQRHAEAGDVVPVGDVLVTFEPEGGASAEADDGASEPADGGADEPTAGTGSEEPAEATGEETGADGRVFAPPSVRRLAREEGVEIGSLEGTGPSGRITEADVREAAAGDGRADPAADGDDEGATTSAGAEAETAVAAGDTGGAVAAPESAADRDRTLATPATRKLAAELGVDVDAVPASDERDGEGAVTPADVRAFAEREREASAEESATGAEKSEPTTVGSADGPVEREPYRGVRKTIGEAMARSKRTAPHATHHDRVDATGLVETRERLRPLAEERDVNLTYLPIVMKAVVAALQDHPVMNTSLDEEREEICYKQYYNVGVATATEAGLMVPVVESVDEKGLLEIAREVSALVAAARDRSIAREAMQGGTFTVTNFGAVGGEYATPILNPPETAILGLGELAQRPVVEGGSLTDPGEVVARPVLPLSLSIDHRVIDGAEAAQFVETLKEYLREPRTLLLG